MKLNGIRNRYIKFSTLFHSVLQNPYSNTSKAPKIVICFVVSEIYSSGLFSPDSIDVPQ